LAANGAKPTVEEEGFVDQVFVIGLGEHGVLGPEDVGDFSASGAFEMAVDDGVGIKAHFAPVGEALDQAAVVQRLKGLVDRRP